MRQILNFSMVRASAEIRQLGLFLEQQSQMCRTRNAIYLHLFATSCKHAPEHSAHCQNHAHISPYENVFVSLSSRVHHSIKLLVLSDIEEEQKSRGHHPDNTHQDCTHY